MQFLTIAIILAAIATAASLALGLFSMTRGEEYDRQHSTHYMKLRVGFQAAALALLLLAFYLSP